MGDVLENAASWLDGVRKMHASRTVAYEQDGRTADVAATITKRSYQVTDTYGASVWVEATDFLVSAADLVIAGVETLPKVGDQIRVEVGGKVETYEVLSPGGNMRHYTAADPHRVIWRIHTKHVDTE